MAKLDQPVPGLYFDELSKIRVLESEASAQNNELKEECQDFVESEVVNHITSLHPLRCILHCLVLMGELIQPLSGLVEIEEFQRGISDFSEILDKLAKQVEHEKMKVCRVFKS